MEISTFLISKFKSLDLHEKSLDLSNYEIFPHKILKSRTFKKSCCDEIMLSDEIMLRD